MSAEPQATEQNDTSLPTTAADAEQPANRDGNQDSAEDEDADDEEEEAKLKYAKLTGSLTNVYRNGDSTSAFTVAGDKMVLGTHNGNIHVLSLPTLQSLRTYHAHSASITCLSVSPTPPPPSVSRPTKDGIGNSTLRSPPSSVRAPTIASKSESSPRTPRTLPNIPSTPNNAIYIATSSLDGHVCISSLLEPKDVQLRNFARPVQAVCLSPDYKSDRTYLSGGLAGQLVLTVGGKAGVTTDANTNSSAAAATSGFLGAFGIGSDRGKDTVLHSGEGAISCIKWSLSGKWVVWINEEGIRIMRSHLKLGSENQDDAWKRIAHDARPNLRGWEEMVGFWRGRAEWVDERKLEADDEHVKVDGQVNGVDKSPEKRPTSKKGAIEKLVVGWGNTACILHVTEDTSTSTTGKRVVGSVQKPFRIRFDDCVVSGLSLYTPNFYAILAYRTHDDDNKPIQQPNTNDSNGTSARTKTRRGRHNRQTALAPQLRLVNMHTGDVDAIDDLSISRFESLSAPDYHLASLFIPHPSEKDQAAPGKGALEGIWEGTRNATRIFSSAASVRSSHSSDGRSLDNVTSPGSSAVGVPLPLPAGRRIGITDAHPFAASPGLKLFIQSPYDCVLAVKTDLKDHLQFQLEQRNYQQVWDLIDKHHELAETMSASETTERRSVDSPSSPSSRDPGGSLADFFADETASQRSGCGGLDSVARREKFRIGELWLQQLANTGRWEEAGKVAGKVLGTSRRWQHWVLTFDQAGKFDEITPYIPTDANVPGLVYEVVLGHYIAVDLSRFQELLDLWKPEKELYDVGSVRAAVESKLDSDDIEDGSEDWKILMEALAELYLANGRAREALRCYIRVQNAEKAMDLMRGEGLLDVIAPEDVPGLLMLRVSKEQMRSAPLYELEEASSEVVKLLVEQALNGSLLPATVIDMLENSGRSYRPFLFFYLRALWNSAPERSETERRPPTRRKYDRRAAQEGQAFVEDHADLTIELFAEYDRDLLMTFLRQSEVYNYEKASAICEQRNYIPELVYVLSRTGQTQRALFLIIDEIGDVKQAVDLAKENPDLWDDLLDYSMAKPTFIRGLLEEVGTAIDPIQLVQRIPEGLQIEGLKEGVAKMLREYDIQSSISEGVARVLRGEVSAGMDTLRAGQKKAVKFEVVHDVTLPLLRGESFMVDSSAKPDGEAKTDILDDKSKQGQPGHCVGCGEVFQEDEKETLIGFACGHVYHLSCLLRSNPATSDPEMIERLLGQLGSSDGDEGYTGRSVGAKVARAFIIKNVVKGGCWHCGQAKAA